MINVPAYMKIRQYIISLVDTHGDTDTRIESERELCRKFSVTRPTVRKALKDLVDDGWLDVRQGKGTYISPDVRKNSNLSACRFYRIMVLFGDGKAVYYSGYFMNIIARICDALKKRSAFLQMPQLANADMLEEIALYNPDGILWVRPVEQYNQMINEIRKTVPVCVIGSTHNKHATNVTMNYFEAGEILASWFLDHNISRPIFAGHSKNSDVKDDIYSGWNAEFEKRSLKYDESLCVHTNENMLEKTTALLRKNTADGIFCYNSVRAVIDQALDASPAPVPLLVDEDHTEIFGLKHPATGKVNFFAPELASLAVNRIFEIIADGVTNGTETVLPAYRVETIY